MAKEIQIVVSGGSIRFIHDDNLMERFAGNEVQTKRASHVEPTTDGQWQADLSPVKGPILGPFTRRDQALAAEVAWLQAHNTPIPTT